MQIINISSTFYTPSDRLLHLLNTNFSFSSGLLKYFFIWTRNLSVSLSGLIKYFFIWSIKLVSLSLHDCMGIFNKSTALQDRRLKLDKPMLL